MHRAHYGILKIDSARSAIVAVSFALLLATSPVIAQSGGSADGPTVASLYGDFMHYARVGQFDQADQFAQSLLGHPDLDPVTLMRVADQDPRSLETLLIIIRNSTLGENAERVISLIQEGESLVRQDTERIKLSIEKLGGPPQMEHFATQRLIESGEYAVPWMIHALMDPAKAELHSRILTAMPKIGRSALNPLVAALVTNDEATRVELIQVLGAIGYPQAVPYLQKVAVQEGLNPATLKAAVDAGKMIEAKFGRPLATSPAAGFYLVGQQYYDEVGSVAADPRLETANVWYWNEQTSFVEATPVPQQIFGQVMAMRCCEESLQIDPSGDEAIALWLAANIRREARLGLDVESPEQAQGDLADATKQQDFPRSLYFTRAAGARYAHLVLERAVKDRDAQVALGAIAALHSVAGEASLVGTEDFKQPLVQALEFPNRVVRIRAALALANALPATRFAGAPLIVPILAGALVQNGGDRFVVVDVDSDSMTRIQSELRIGSSKVVAEGSFNKALSRARGELDGVSAFFLSTDIEAPGLASAVEALQREFYFAQTPIVILVKDGGHSLASQMAAAFSTVRVVDAGASGSELIDLAAQIQAGSGGTTLDPALASSLALEAADALGRVAIHGRTALDHARAQDALIEAAGSGDEELQTRCLAVLSLIGTSGAQRAVADAALFDANSETLRLIAFDTLATSAKVFGNQLDDDRVSKVLNLARTEADLVMRSAASQALGALDLSNNKASEIIRGYYRG